MVKREIKAELNKLLKEYPVVILLGPRQSGKTTLALSLKKYDYCNLENIEDRQFATEDPKAFLEQFKGPVILDEIQRVPSLLSNIQVLVDQEKKNGRFVLTGSHQLELKEALTQSLAGRAGLLYLLPFSIGELEKAGIQHEKFEDYIYTGFLPRIYDQKQRPSPSYSNYYQTYLERDVRRMLNLKNQNLFEKFIKLLAGRVGQVLNVHSLANDTGVDSKTIHSWLSLLEASFIIYKLPPYFKNFGKRVIKSPKYYFTEVGLLAFLLGIQKAQHVSRDPLVGSLFENMVIIEALKSQWNKGHHFSNLYFFRDSNGNEVDLLYQSGSMLKAFEIKSSSTTPPSLTKIFQKIKSFHPKIKMTNLIYNGKTKKLSTGHLIHFKKTASYLEA